MKSFAALVMGLDATTAPVGVARGVHVQQGFPHLYSMNCAVRFPTLPPAVKWSYAPRVDESGAPLLDDDGHPLPMVLTLTSGPGGADLLEHAVATSVIDGGADAYPKVTGTTWASLPASHGVVPHVDILGAAVGEFLHVYAAVGVQVDGPQEGASVRVAAIQDYPAGTAVVVPGAEVRIVKRIGADADGNEVAIFAGCHPLIGSLKVTTAGPVRVVLQGRNEHADGSVGLPDGARFTLLVARCYS